MTTRHPSLLRACAWLVGLLVATGGALAVAPAARADAETAVVVCWKRLLNDWYDGRIDRAYPVRCYREAIANLPDDVKVYADAEEDIRRALLQAIRESKKATGKDPTPATPVKPPSRRETKPGTTGRTETETERGAETETGSGVPPSSGRDPGEPFPEALPSGTTRSADSVPLPLIVLGALALLLLAAAGAGLASKRLQARRLAAGGPPTEEPPPVA